MNKAENGESARISRSSRRGVVRLAAVMGLSIALILGTAGAAAATPRLINPNPPVTMDGYLYAGTYSSTTACMARGDYLRSWDAILDYFCHPVRRASWLYVHPSDDD